MEEKVINETTVLNETNVVNEPAVEEVVVIQKKEKKKTFNINLLNAYDWFIVINFNICMVYS